MASPPQAPNLLGMTGPGPNYGATMNAAGQVQGGTAVQGGQFTPEGEEKFQRYLSQLSPAMLAASGGEAGLRARFAKRYASDPSMVTQSQSAYVPAAAQGSQIGQQAAMQALQMLSPYATNAGLTPGERGAMQMAGLQQQAGQQAAIQALAQQAASRGLGRSGAAFVSGANAAQSGANNMAQIGYQAGIGAQNRQLGAIGTMFGQGLGLDTQAMNRGSALDQFNQQATQTRIGAASQDYQNQMAQYQADQQRRMAPWNMLTQAGTTLGGAAIGRPSGGGGQR